jgi:predicted DNA-binding transcriptional regulator AlpA
LSLLFSLGILFSCYVNFVTQARSEGRRFSSLHNLRVTMANRWLEPSIDAYLFACAQGHTPGEAVVIAESIPPRPPYRMLTRRQLRDVKGIAVSRQWLSKLVRRRAFPRPFQMSSKSENSRAAPTAHAESAGN